MTPRFREKLKQLEEKSRLRTLSLPRGIDLTSNDYLGLRSHPDLRRAAVEALEAGIDLGAGGSRLLRGHSQAHEELESFAAPFFGAEKTLYFATGYQANLALFTTLPSRQDVILYDAFIHASARDGIESAHARSVKFPHNDLNACEDALKRMKESAEQIWIAVESLYSMDGDAAPVREFHTLAKKYDAVLIVDEAHATGVLGESGKGLAYGMGQENLITLHTCGKALGAAGGLVCAPADIIDYLINAARPFIFSTAPPPLQAMLVREALNIIQSADGQARREKLFALCRTAQALFGGPGSHIVPVVLGEDRAALKAARELQDAGFDIRAIRPPTVPEGTARLRISLGSELGEDILRDVARHLAPHLERKAA